MRHCKVLFVFILFLFPFVSSAKSILRMGLVDRMAYPFIEEQSNLRNENGLLFELSRAIARPLNAKLEFSFIPRKRVEPMLHSGKVDVICYLSSKWFDEPNAVNFSKENLLQVERIITKKEGSIPSDLANDQSLSGKKIALRLGYHYPQLSEAFTSKRLIRIDKDKVADMFEIVRMKKADYMITSEPEIEGYFKEHPDKREEFAIQKEPFDTVKTQCAISKNSVWKTQQINRALDIAAANGTLEKMSKKYNLSY